MAWAPAFGQNNAVTAAPEEGLEQVDSVPSPPPIRSGEVLEPEITIIQDQRGTVREYRIGSRLVGIKVTPEGAPAYYLIDADGDGHFEERRHGLGSDILINSWVLFTW